MGLAPFFVNPFDIGGIEMIEEPSVIMRTRVPKRLSTDIHKAAAVLKLKPPEIARIAMARGMIGMIPTTAKQPESEAAHADHQ